MKTAIDRISYYKEMIKKNEQVWLQTKSENDKEILAKQIETFRKLQLRFSTLESKKFIKENQLILL
jgi:hypothetical protein